MIHMLLTDDIILHILGFVDNITMINGISNQYIYNNSLNMINNRKKIKNLIKSITLPRYCFSTITWTDNDNLIKKERCINKLNHNNSTFCNLCNHIAAYAPTHPYQPGFIVR